MAKIMGNMQKSFNHFFFAFKSLKQIAMNNPIMDITTMVMERLNCHPKGISANLLAITAKTKHKAANSKIGFLMYLMI
jgi:hypothetical protein